MKVLDTEVANNFLHTHDFGANLKQLYQDILHLQTMIESCRNDIKLTAQMIANADELLERVVSLAVVIEKNIEQEISTVNQETVEYSDKLMCALADAYPDNSLTFADKLTKVKENKEKLHGVFFQAWISDLNNAVIENDQKIKALETAKNTFHATMEHVTDLKKEYFAMKNEFRSHVINFSKVASVFNKNWSQALQNMASACDFTGGAEP